MNDLKDLFQREAANVDLAPDMPPGTARRARRARVRTAAAGGAALLLFIVGGIALTPRITSGLFPPASRDGKTVSPVRARGVERGVDWSLETKERGRNRCLTFVALGREHGCAPTGSSGPPIAVEWIPEIRRTVIFGSLEGAQQRFRDVTIQLEGGGRFGGLLARDVFYQFLKPRHLRGTVAGESWAYRFDTTGEQARIESINPFSLYSHGPWSVIGLDTGDFNGGYYDLDLMESNAGRLCMRSEERRFCTHIDKLDGGAEIVGEIRGDKERLVFALVGNDVAHATIEFDNEQYDLQILPAERPGGTLRDQGGSFRYVSAIVRLGEADLVLGSGSQTIERIPLALPNSSRPK